MIDVALKSHPPPPQKKKKKKKKEERKWNEIGKAIPHLLEVRLAYKIAWGRNGLIIFSLEIDEQIITNLFKWA